MCNDHSVFTELTLQAWTSAPIKALQHMHTLEGFLEVICVGVMVCVWVYKSVFKCISRCSTNE